MVRILAWHRSLEYVVALSQRHKNVAGPALVSIAENPGGWQGFPVYYCINSYFSYSVLYCSTEH